MKTEMLEQPRSFLRLSSRRLRVLGVCLCIGLPVSEAAAQSSAAAPAAVIVPQTRHTLGLNSAVVSPDGRFVVSSGEDQLLKLWDVKTGRLVRNVLRMPREVKFWRADALSEGGRRLLGIESDRVKLWDTLSGKEILSLPNTSTADNSRGVVMSKDGKRIAAISTSGALTLYDADAGKELQTLAGHAGAVTTVAFSPDGTLLVSGGRDRTVRSWHAASGRPVRTFPEASESVATLAFTDDGRRVLALGAAEVRLWDVESGSQVWRHEDKDMAAATVSPDGRRVLVEIKDGKLEVWDPAAGSRIASFAQPANGAFLGFSADGARLIFGPRQRNSESDEAAWLTRAVDAATGRIAGTVSGASNSHWAEGRHLFVEDADSSLGLRDLDTGREFQKLPGQPAITASVLSANGTLAASAGPQGVSVRDAETGRPVAGCPAAPGEVRALALAPDGRRLLAGGDNKQIVLCNLESRQVERTFDGRQAIRALAFSPDGKRILSGDGEGNVKAWSLEAGRTLWTARSASQRDITAVAFSPDGKRAFAGTGDNRVRILDAATGREAKLLRFLIGPVATVAVSPDGKRVAAAGYSEVLVKQWEVETGTELQRLSGGQPPGRFVMVDAISFSPPPYGLLAAASNNRLVAWRAADGRRVLEAAIVDQELKAVAFSRDGKRLTAIDEAGAIRHWSVATGDPLLTIVPYGAEDWVAVTPEGFFEASAGGEQHLSRVRGLDAQPLGDLKGELHRPDLVAAKLAGDPKGAVREAARRLDLRK